MILDSRPCRWIRFRKRFVLFSPIHRRTQRELLHSSLTMTIRWIRSWVRSIIFQMNFQSMTSMQSMERTVQVDRWIHSRQAESILHRFYRLRFLSTDDSGAIQIKSQYVSKPFRRVPDRRIRCRIAFVFWSVGRSPSAKRSLLPLSYHRTM